MIGGPIKGRIQSGDYNGREEGLFSLERGRKLAITSRVNIWDPIGYPPNQRTRSSAEYKAPVARLSKE